MFYCCLLFQAIPAYVEQQLVDFLSLINLIQSFDVTDTPDVTSNLIQRFDVTDTSLPDINSEGERINSLSASLWFSLHFYHGNALIWLVGIRGIMCLAGSGSWEIDFLPPWKLNFTTVEIDFYHGNALIRLVGIRGKMCLAGSRTWGIDFLPPWKLNFTTVEIDFYHNNTLIWLVVIRGTTCLAGCRKLRART